MALIELTLSSRTLNAVTNVWVCFPEQTGADKLPQYRPGVTYQTLWLLHGGGVDCSSWFRYTSLERYACEKKLIVVCPSAYLSLYTDMAYGPAYYSWITQELPQLMRWMLPISPRREDNFVAGLSMGGYGALKWAANEPERFCCAGSFSGAVDMPSIIRENHMRDGMIVDDNFVFAFGSVENAEHNENDVLYQLRRKKDAGTDLPRLYLDVGTEDFTYRFNARMRDALADLDLTWHEQPGTHEWGYWDGAVQRYLSWLPLKGTPLSEEGTT